MDVEFMLSIGMDGYGETLLVPLWMEARGSGHENSSTGNPLFIKND